MKSRKISIIYASMIKCNLGRSYKPFFKSYASKKNNIVQIIFKNIQKLRKKTRYVINIGP